MFRLSSLSLVAAASVTLASLAISGCATGSIADPTPGNLTGALKIEGNAFGGSTPLVGAKITIWESDPGSTGYPSATNESAKSLATTTTADGVTSVNGSVPAAGSWSISSTYSCDTPLAGTAGPFLYVTATGGNTGAGINNNSVLIAALGACSSVLSNASTLHVTVNESSTIAAAYALGNFIYVDNTNPGSQGVYIGSDASNNAVTGSCGVTNATAGPQGPTGTKCAAAGLSHAFANAFNLGDDANIGSQALGQAQSFIPANPFTSTPAVTTASVPMAELNTLANILATCVNSTGGTGSTTSCGKLFTLTPNGSGVVPKDTLTAAINIAQNPGQNVGSATLSGLYGLVTTSGPYQPTLTTYPHDWSVGIVYTPTYPSSPTATTANVTSFTYTFATGGTTGTITATAGNAFSANETLVLNGFTNANDSVLNGSTVLVTSANGTSFTGTTSYVPATAETFNSAAGDTGIATLPSEPEAVALDTNDNVYAPFLTPTSGGFITSISSNGVTNWTSAPSPNVCGAFSIATDTANNVWVPNYTSSTFCTSSTSGIYGFSQASGAATQSLTKTSNGVLNDPFALAIDANNNVWYGVRSSSCNTTAPYVCVAEVPLSGTTYGTSTTSSTFGSASGATINVGSGIGHLLIDFNQDVWAGPYESKSGSNYIPVNYIPNSGTTASPKYATVYQPATYAVETYGMLAIDSNGDLWSGAGASSNGYLFSYNSATGSAVGAATAQYSTTTNSSFNPSKPYEGQFDGSNRLFFVSTSGSGQIWFYSPSLQAGGTQTNPNTVVATDMVPCYLPGGSSSCSSTIATNEPTSLQIDSTGAIWVAGSTQSIGTTVGTTQGYLVQIIGTAAPTWPQLSYGQGGNSPKP